jgi:ribosomal protein L27
VIKRARGLDGETIGRAHDNPLFDSQEYEVKFTDGTREKYQVNIIAENMFAQVDSKGNQFLLLQEITDHKKDHSAIPISEGTVQYVARTESRNPNKRRENGSYTCSGVMVP